MTPGETFARHVTAILERSARQNGLPAFPSDDVARFARGLWSVIARRGLPRPLSSAERGEPGELPPAEIEGLLDEASAGIGAPGRAALAGPAKQLVKACFYPEFKTCRDSFREVSPDGSCRRQELARARQRISGSHCVDCPHWIALRPEQHRRYLAREWKGDPAVFQAHPDIFLPEDFRDLRLFLHAQARAASPGG